MNAADEKQYMDLARNLFQTALEKAAAADAVKISGVSIQIGKWSGVDKGRLLRYFKNCSAGTMLETSRVDFNWVSHTAHCLKCGWQADVDGMASACPSCRALNLRVEPNKKVCVTDLQVVSAGAV